MKKFHCQIGDVTDKILTEIKDYAIEPMLLRHNYAMRSDPMKIDFLPTNGTLALKSLPREIIQYHSSEMQLELLI
ncbi:hypothetical protein T05_14735 [Trichinella murrelli]|uniref:Uncharacterized protein n=1 Tax=Trichinella murrelli TaxID=144512 RepID=A0A0V0T598_9BILA|nr:hypothetical protein T05_1792 [Trichinella murrelli]KRX34260.1 hypothetical protein T05_14735 [Trichinella murrelli]